MGSDALNQTVFGVYEFFANIIPGTVIILTFLYVTGYASVLLSYTAVSDSIVIVLLVFLAFVIGLAIQGTSAFFEKYINKRKYGGYPSSLYLNENNPTFAKYFKDKIREIAKKKFGVPIDSESNQIFDLCYTYVMQKNISVRVRDFLRTYIFSRNMMVTMIIEAGLFFYLAGQEQQILFVAAGIASIGLSYVFYARFLRYGESFAKEVLRSFLVEEAPNFADTTKLG